jgi:hypothetical protein
MSSQSPRPEYTPSAWRDAVLNHLMQGGPVCRRAARYVVANNVKIGFSRQSTSAKWTLSGHIELSSDFYPLGIKTHPANRQLLGGVVHEATHLEQGTALALSVAGEVGGWKAEYKARLELGAPIQDPHWKAVALTPDPPSLHDLRQARREMLLMTGYRYLVWLLPLRPNLGTRAIAAVQRMIWRKSDRV